MMTYHNILYRIYDNDDDLLYVGASVNPGHRIQGHAYQQRWWDEASVIKLQRFATWQEMIQAETDAIESENPRYNLIHARKQFPWGRKPRGPKGGGTIFQRSTDGRWIGGIELPPVNGVRRRKTVSGKTRKIVEHRLAQLRVHDIECLMDEQPGPGDPENGL